MQGTIRTVVQDRTTWAVVGLAPDSARDSHRIARPLQRQGTRVLPINAHVETALGERT